MRRAGVVLASKVGYGLSDAAARIARANLGQAAASIKVAAALDSAGLDHVFVKGVTLGMLAYGTLGIKQAADIDLAVDPARYGEACSILEEVGFRCILPGSLRSPAQMEAWVHRFKHTTWVTGHGIAVELHASFLDNPLLLPDLSVRSPTQPITIASGAMLPTLAPDLLYAYLCVHGATHSWSRLKWIADVAALLASNDQAEITHAHAAAQRLGAGRSSGQALLLCAKLFGTPIAPALGRELDRDRVTRYLFRTALASMTRGGADVELDALVLGTVPIHLSHFFLVPGWRYKRAETVRKFFAGKSESGGPLVFKWLLRRAKSVRLTAEQKDLDNV